MHRSGVAVLLLLLASCRSAPADLPLPPLALAAIETVESDFRFGSLPPRLAEGQGPFEPFAGPETTERWVGECTILSMAAVRARALGLIAGHAFVTPTAEARAFLEEFGRQGEVVGRQRLCLYAGQRGSIAVVNQSAYVAAFSFAETEGSALADPVIDVLEDGLRIELQGTAGAADATLWETSVELLATHVPKPLPEVSARLTEASAPVTIQRPVAAVQRLVASAALAPHESLVLVGARPGAPDQRLVIFVEAQRLAPDELPEGDAVLPWLEEPQLETTGPTPAERSAPHPER